MSSRRCFSYVDHLGVARDRDVCAPKRCRTSAVGMGVGVELVEVADSSSAIAGALEVGK